MCNGGCNSKVNTEIYGSSPNHPLKTDEDGVLAVEASININSVEGICEVTGELDVKNEVDAVVGKKNLSEDGQLYSFSINLKNVPKGLIICNPRNSGKTIKIQEIWVYNSILPNNDINIGLVSLYKNNIVDDNAEEVEGGMNLNFGFSNTHAARLYTTSYFSSNSKKISCEGLGTMEKKFIYNGSIIIPPSDNVDRTLLIEYYWFDVYTNNLNITVIWSEE